MSVLKSSQFFLHDGEPPPMKGPTDSNRSREMIKSWSDYQEQFKGAGPGQITGEIGVRYLYSQTACDGIRNRVPAAKLIVVLRHPVQRAHSHYLMYRRNGSESCTTFADALADEPRRCREGWYRGLHKTLGFYCEPLKRYFDTFPREQIKVLLYDDLVTDSAGLMRDLFQFLAVDESFEPDTNRRFNEAGQIANPLLRQVWTTSRNARSRVAPLVPVSLRGRLSNWIAKQPVKPVASEAMTVEIWNSLLNDYRQDIFCLQELIGRDLAHWLRSEP